MKNISYLFIFLLMLLLLCLLPKAGGYMVQAEVMNIIMAGMATLLVWLIARLLGTDNTAGGI